MAVPNSEAVRWLPSGSTDAESRSGRIGPIILEAKQTGERSAGNPHAAFDEAGAGNVARPRWCDTRRRKSEPTGNTNFGLNRRASPRPYQTSPTAHLHPHHHGGALHRQVLKMTNIPAVPTRRGLVASGT